jgi:hypothetical protein
MSRRLSKLSKLPLSGIAVAALTLFLLAGCSRGPSQKEMSLLEEKQRSALKVEQIVAQKKAQKAQLERKLAEKNADKEALEQRSTATRSAITEMN